MDLPINHTEIFETGTTLTKEERWAEIRRYFSNGMVHDDDQYEDRHAPEDEI